MLHTSEMLSVNRTVIPFLDHLVIIALVHPTAAVYVRSFKTVWSTNDILNFKESNMQSGVERRTEKVK